MSMMNVATRTSHDEIRAAGSGGHWLSRGLAPAVALIVALGAGCSPEAESGSRESVGSAAQEVAGNIHPSAIQIDGPAASPPGADLFANVGAPLNAGATVDWVADSTGNTGTGCLGSDAIATCVEANVTGAPGGAGHWNGVRIVDGIGGSENDIFLTGGKENDTSTWNIGPGSVGSSKYDATQAYLANNQTNLYFGMERRGNNGTTAFDFEFNQLAPMALPSCPQNPLIPCRSVSDVLFTFEVQGSGGSGSATPHVFTWNGTSYVEGAAAGILSSINNSTTTAGAPWGHVDSHGAWVLGNLDRFTFAEAVAPISLLPGVNSCGGTAYVQIRTRSSSTASSDLKDTTKVFQFVFNSISAQATLTPSCLGGFNYSASGTAVDGTPIANPVCSWTFSNGSTSNLCSGFLASSPGSVTGTVTVTDPSAASCNATSTSSPVAVFAPLSVVADLTATCSSSFTYDATPSGGSNPAGVTYAWTFSGGGTVSPSTSAVKSGAVAVGTPRVAYTGNLTVTDPRTDITCTATGSDTATPLAPIAVDLALQGAGGTCPGLTTDGVTYAAQAVGGDGAYTYTWNGAACTGTSCAVNPADSTFCFNQSLSVSVDDGSALCPPATSETETYAKTTTVTASNLP